ncbi:ABC transporter substrate-binding protein [Tengunoibacter tsumagoiensis]|uniref:ABC transporter substrate-binding protein n=1 Tax=Tengunoibacter tsumagoiensis TaxID=2014871 RepID=A0A402A0W8_9CHLR|nr:ABC transporter substrate-binding protein [Tengunoibacter tsumagoiensis]GCE12763.1 hypothetical protein KTT_26220 [Tengunoibacter tsumagoiensis]
MSQVDSSIQSSRLFASEQPASVLQQPLNRRRMLKLLGATTAVTAGGGILAACGGTSDTTVQVTLQASGAWPINSMPTADAQAKDPFQKAYADWLQSWLKKNAGVKIKASSANIWDPQALSTAISTGTAATWYLASVIGGDDAGTRAVFARGLAADTTDLFSHYASQMPLSAYAADAWKNLWHLNGHYYGAPGDYFPGRGVYYRRDLLKEAGLEEPKVGWTWQDLRTLAKGLTTSKRKGIVFQKNALSYLLSTYQFDALTMIPLNTGSNWHWKYDYSSKADEWAKIVSIYRGMVFDDQSVLQDVTYGETDAEKAFFRGDVAMAEMHSSFFTHPVLGDPSSPLALAQQLKKPLDEVVGYVIDPVAPNGAFGATQGSLGVVSFDPHLSSAGLEKAFKLYCDFWLIDGVVACNQASYKAQPTPENAQSIYQSVTPTNKANGSIPGIPGTSETYWGTNVVASLLEGTKVPLVPNYSLYVPAEQVAGPPQQAVNDAITKLAFYQQDVKGILTDLESTRNQQAASLPSSASQDDFNKGAKNYYRALATFWQKNAPDYYQNEYLPWYQKSVQPLLGKI